MNAKKILVLLMLLFAANSKSHAQAALISIEPDSTGQGNYYSTIVTGTTNIFTWGSAPMASDCHIWATPSGDITATSVEEMNDTQVRIKWLIPTNASVGNFPVSIGIYDIDQWGLPVFNNYYVPGGVTIVSCPVSPTSIVTANGATQICFGDSTELEVTTGPGYSYQWYYYDYPIPNATNTSYFAPNSGYYRCLVTAPSGCNSMSNWMYIQVNSLPNANIWPLNFTYSFCKGGSNNLHASNSPSYSYQWFLNGNAINGANGSIYNVSVEGNYTALVTASWGCSKMSQPLYMSELPLPAAPIAANGPTTFCVLDSVVLSTNQVSGYQYQWYKYGNYIPFATSSSYAVTKSGNYKVRVMDTNGCSRKSGSITATVIPLPQASISANGPTTFCSGDSVLLSAIINSGDTYQWKKYSNLLTGETSPDLNVKVPGKYKCIVTNSYGCSRTSNKIVVSVPCRTALQSIAIVNADVPFKLINNHLIPDAEANGQLAIYSIEGKLIVPLSPFTAAVDLEEFTPGVYIIQFIGDDRSVYHEKVVISE